MKNYWEDEYLDLIHHIIHEGEERHDRTGVGTMSIFGDITHIDLKRGFPALTTRKLQWKPMVAELLWFLEGSSDERRLAEIQYGKPREELVGKNTIWTANADKQGKDLGYINGDLKKELGKIYGVQYRNFNGYDQIAALINGLKTDPHSRRHFVSAWNPPELNKMALPPCHLSFQMYLGKKGLSTSVYMRSNDVVLGKPFNIASYALLTHMVASHLDVDVDKLIMTTGDTHVYMDHIQDVQQQFEREILDSPTLKLPKIESFDIEYIETLSVDDFVLENYQHHPAIKFNMAV